jgi:Holliday junction resolvase RusA-like endonuclease
MIEFQYKGKLIGYNQRYVKGYVLSKQYRQFKQNIQFAFMEKYLGMKPFCGRLTVTIRYNSKHDVDNIAKAINDSLEGYAFLNDRQIDEIHIYRDNNIEKGCVYSVDFLS